MQKRLWFGITWPSMVLTIITGGWMIWEVPSFLSQAYFLLKLLFVGGLVLYHLQCHRIFTQLQNDIVKRTSFKLRLWNELATVFLVAIVFLIVLKSKTGFMWGMLGLAVFAGIIMMAVNIYKKSREK